MAVTAGTSCVVSVECVAAMWRTIGHEVPAEATTVMELVQAREGSLASLAWLVHLQAPGVRVMSCQHIFCLGPAIPPTLAASVGHASLDGRTEEIQGLSGQAMYRGSAVNNE